VSPATDRPHAPFALEGTSGFASTPTAVPASQPAKTIHDVPTDTSLGRVQECAQVLFADLPYALLRAKMTAEMVINAKCGAELLRQVGADETRLDLAEAFIRRRVIESESIAKRIEQNHMGRLECDARILAGVTLRTLRLIARELRAVDRGAVDRWWAPATSCRR
jgi:hypothetical protein